MYSKWVSTKQSLPLLDTNTIYMLPGAWAKPRYDYCWRSQQRATVNRTALSSTTIIHELYPAVAKNALHGTAQHIVYASAAFEPAANSAARVNGTKVRAPLIDLALRTNYLRVPEHPPPARRDVSSILVYLVQSNNRARRRIHDDETKHNQPRSHSHSSPSRQRPLLSTTTGRPRSC